MDCDAVEFVLCAIGAGNKNIGQNVTGTNQYRYCSSGLMQGLTQDEYNDLYGDVIITTIDEGNNAHKIDEENNAHKIDEVNNAHKIEADEKIIEADEKIIAHKIKADEAKITQEVKVNKGNIDAVMTTNKNKKKQIKIKSKEKSNLGC